MALSHLIGCLLIAWLFLFYSIPAMVWFISATLITLFFYTFNAYSLFTCVFGYVGFLLLYSLTSVKFVRRKFITANFIGFFKKQLPQISDTEAQAIEAGDVWWEGQIFQGKLDWSAIKNNKLTKLNIEEQAFLDNEVEYLCNLADEWEVIFKNKDLSEEAWSYLKQNRFFALVIPKEYGGLGFSATAQSSIVTKIASKSITAAVSIMVPNALGPAELLIHYGTDKQKSYYLPRLASSKEIPCFALTSLYAGSDAGGMEDQGIICKQLYNGVETLGIKLNFSKRYITLAPVATVMGLAFKLYDPNNLYSQKKDLGITLALIPTNHPGINIGKRHYPMLTPFQNGPISGQDVFIPMEFIIGGNDYIGKGWFMLMECLSGGRGISLPALSTAAIQVSYLSSIAYSSLRKQFKVPIAKLEGIQEQIAKVSGINFIANAVRVVTTSAIDTGLKPAVVSGIAKYHMTEFARICINSAMDIHAGKGVMVGPSNYLFGSYMANPVAITVEGANILTRNLIIFGQGAFRAHPYILKELQALQDSNKSDALRKFDIILFKHIKFVCSNKIKLVTYGLQRIYRPWFKRSDWLKNYQKDITRMSVGLAFATDMALLFMGGSLKFKERMSARLGDAVSAIYMALCVINFYHDQTKQYKDDAVYMKNLELNTKWALDYLLYSAETALAEFIRNFPVRVAALSMRIIIMPWGHSYLKPKDNLEQQMVLSSLSPTAYYNKMVELCYKKDSVLAELYEAFKEQHKLKDLLNKLELLSKQKEISSSNNLNLLIEQAYAKRCISEQEYAALIRFSNQVEKIINVDEFDNLHVNLLKVMKNSEPYLQ